MPSDGCGMTHGSAACLALRDAPPVMTGRYVPATSVKTASSSSPSMESASNKVYPPGSFGRSSNPGFQTRNNSTPFPSKREADLRRANLQLRRGLRGLLYPRSVQQLRLRARLRFRLGVQALSALRTWISADLALMYLL